MVAVVGAVATLAVVKGVMVPRAVKVAGVR
jgi:hypothetical protein